MKAKVVCLFWCVLMKVSSNFRSDILRGEASPDFRHRLRRLLMFARDSEPIH